MMNDKKVLELFIDGVMDEGYYHDAEEFEQYLKELYSDGRIIKEQLDNLEIPELTSDQIETLESMQ